MPAWLFMWSLSFAIFAALKWMTWWKARNRVPANVGRSLAYLLAWPGMDAETFLDARVHAGPAKAQGMALGGDEDCAGIVLLWVIARRIPARAIPTPRMDRPFRSRSFFCTSAASI